MRRFPSIGAAEAALGTALRTGAAAFHMPGWKTQSSTKDARSREQREADRKARQIEKLPRPEALHDFQYPYEKTVLSDSMFQYPVYETELDTPHLFNLTPPPDFFVYWNVSDFERTAYPAVPKNDHRTLVPSAQSPEWVEHRARLLRYLRKHEVYPHYVPHIHADVNLSVVFPGQYSTRARLTDDEGEPLPVPPPETALTRRNFWFTAHCGNYIELTDVQQPPSVFILESADAASAPATTAAGEGSGQGSLEAASAAAPSYYTLVIVSPDFPYRVPMSHERLHADKGFFLNYMVANLTPQAAVAAAAQVNGRVVNTEGTQSRGDVVIPYVAPLPTEEAGTTRHLCLLFKQLAHVPRIQPLTPEEERRHFPLAKRADFRLHRRREPTSTAGPAACLAGLRAVEDSITADPSAVTFFTTKWDIQVQEYYEKVGLPEPAAPVDEEVEALLEYHATPPEQLRVRARHRPDGSVNTGEDPQFWGQTAPTRMMDGSMQRGSGWSRRTAMGTNGVPVVYPH